MSDNDSHSYIHTSSDKIEINWVLCECGRCDDWFPPYDSNGRGPRRYAQGHNRRGKKKNKHLVYEISNLDLKTAKDLIYKLVSNIERLQTENKQLEQEKEDQFYTIVRKNKELIELENKLEQQPDTNTYIATSEDIERMVMEELEPPAIED